MINVTGATLVKPKLMADNSIRLEIDFGELITLSEIDDLRRKVLKVVIVAEDLLKDIED